MPARFKPDHGGLNRLFGRKKLASHGSSTGICLEPDEELLERLCISPAGVRGCDAVQHQGGDHGQAGPPLFAGNPAEGNVSSPHNLTVRRDE